MFAGKTALVIELGEPHSKGSELILTKGELLLGRPWQEHKPDFPFTNMLISKHHVKIIYADGYYAIVDLFSKHGTMLNNTPLAPEKEYILKHGDRICLAHGAVQFRFQQQLASVAEQTSELNDTGDLPLTLISGLHIDYQKRIVLIDSQAVKIIGKDADLLMFLYQNKNKAVSYDEIRLHIWPERSLSLDGYPDVEKSEITTLVYRLRKRLRPYHSKISTVSRFGYRFDE